MEQRSKWRGRRKFLKALESDPYIETGAYAIILGIDPKRVLDQGREDYLIDIAFMQKALKLTTEQKIEEVKVLSELIGYEVAKAIAKIF